MTAPSPIIQPATPLKLWRAAQGLTQQAAADKLGYRSLRAYQEAETQSELRPTLALAMAAVAAGLEPWQPPIE